MSIDQDVLNTTNPDLRNLLFDTFTQYNPLIDILIKTGRFKKEAAGGPFIEFSILTGGPGKLTTIRGGSEVLNGTLASITKLGNEYPNRAIYSYDVPNKKVQEIRSAASQSIKKEKLKDLLEAYPVAAMGDAADGTAFQMLTGKASANSATKDNSSNGTVTFNGDMSYYPQDALTARRGIFQFAAPASQNVEVHGIMSQGGTNGVNGWANQYGVVTSGALQKSTLRALTDLCDQQGAMFGGSKVDMMISDTGSRAKYIDGLDDKVEYATYPIKGDGVDAPIREGIKFAGRVIWYSDSHVDIADTAAFSGAALEGVTYGFTLDHWNLFTMDGGGDLWSSIEITPYPDRDMKNHRMVSHWNMFCKSRRTQFAATGTNRS